MAFNYPKYKSAVTGTPFTQKSENIGPAISDEMMKELLKKRSDAEYNLNVSDDEAHAAGQKVQKEIDEQRKYIKK